MKKLWLSSLLALGLLVPSVAFAITEKQSIVMPVLEKLKLELIKSDVIGGPQRFKITPGAIKLLQDAMKDGKVIILDNDGTITIDKDPGKGEKK